MPGSLWDLHAEACETCLVNCSSLHHYTAPQCPVRTCNSCHALAVLDVEIAGLEARLARCAEQRRHLKTTINSHHDCLQIFPFEITSQIFNYVVEDDDPRYLRSSPDYLGNPVLVLGAVCKQWQDITFNAPELWSRVTIDLWKLTSNDCFDIIKILVARSRSAPLFLRINTALEPPNTVDDEIRSRVLERMSSIVGPQCGRLKGLYLDGPPSFIQDIFHEFDQFPALDSLKIDTQIRPGTPEPTFIPTVLPTIPHGLNPQALHILGFCFFRDVPLRCNRLTYLDAEMIAAKELLYIIKNAPVLQTLKLHIITRTNEIQDFLTPGTHIKHKSLKHLYGDTCTFSILSLLTLPALKTLTHTFITKNIHLDGFLDCVRRSRLNNLTHLSIICQTMTLVTDYINGHWYDEIPSLTHFRVQIPHIVFLTDNERLDMVKGFISPLDTQRKLLAFPLLEEFGISAPSFYGESWSLLYNMLRPRTITDITHVRPLHHVVVQASYGYVDLNSATDKHICFLDVLQRSGVQLEIKIDGHVVHF